MDSPASAPSSDLILLILILLILFKAVVVAEATAATAQEAEPLAEAVAGEVATSRAEEAIKTG